MQEQVNVDKISNLLSCHGVGTITVVKELEGHTQPGTIYTCFVRFGSDTWY